MKIDGKELARAIEWVGHKVDKRTNNEYISMVITDKGEVSLSRYMSMFYFKTPLHATNVDTEATKVHMNATVLLNSVRAIKAHHDIDIIISENNVRLVTKTMNITVPTSSGVHRTPKETTVIGGVSAPEYFTTLNKISVLCETGLPDTNQQLESVNIIFNNDTMTMYATNRYVLGKASLNYQPKQTARTITLLPHEYASMIKATQAGTGEVELVTETSSGKFGYRFDDGREALFSTYDSEEGEELILVKMSDTATAFKDNTTVLPLSEMKEKIGIIDSLSYDTMHVVVEADSDQLVLSNDQKTGVFVTETTSITGYDNGKETFLLNREMVKKALQSLPGASFALVSDHDDNRKMVRVSPVDEKNIPRNDFVVAIVVIRKR